MLTIAVQMDPIAGINITGDSTFAMLLEAQARGHKLLYYTPDALALAGGRVFATVEDLAVRDVKGDHFTLANRRRIDLTEVDVVLMRQDPPFDLAYITTTHLLERIAPTTLVVNDPTGVRDAPEKILVTTFPDLMPPTLITRSPEEIAAFRAAVGDVVMKPLYGHGGKAVFHIRTEDDNAGSLVDLFSGLYREPFVIQKFLPEVKKGDKRILFIEDEAVAAINRVPAEFDLRSNMVRGGRAEATELTAREREICTAIGPTLKAMGFLFTGIDVIGDFITEINVTSPTGIRAARTLSGVDVAALLLDRIEEKRAAM